MNWVRLGLLPNYLQAEALKARLYSEGVEARVVEQTHTGSTAGEPALRLGGVSAVSSGHPVLVREEDLEKAKEIASQFAIEISENSKSATPELINPKDVEPPYMVYRRRFLLIGVIGSMVPFFTLLALYWFVRYLRSGGPLLKPKIMLALLFCLGMTGLHTYVYWDDINQLTSNFNP